MIWQEILKVAKEKSLPVILIQDEKKEDWWYFRDNGKHRIGPCPAMVGEFSRETGQEFLMYSTSRFLHWANKMLKAEINETAIEEARDLANSQSAEIDMLREADVLEDMLSEDPVLAAEHKDIRDLVTRGLSRVERLIIVLYYFDEMTMKEIGRELDLSESRVSQMHSAILLRLRKQLDEKRQG